MKIAIIVWALNIKGGTQRQALFLAQKLQGSGNQVTLYTAFYHPEKCYTALLEGKRVRFLFRASPEEEKFLYKPTIVRNIRILRFFIRKKRENDICKNLAELIDADTEILNPHDQHVYKVSYFFKKQRSAPSVGMINDVPSRRWAEDRIRKADSKKTSPFKRLLYLLIDAQEKKFIRAQDKIVVLDKLNQSVIKKYFNVDAIVVRSGLDLRRFIINKQRHRGQREIQHQIRLLMVGILFPYRRFEDGIRAVQILKDWGYNIFLTIIGNDVFDKSYKAKLKDLIHDVKVENRVNFVGEVPEKVLIKNYYESDIFIFPNHIQTWGLVVFEAMASGLPVIVSKTTGASEVLTDNLNALLVDPKNPLAIAKAVKELVDNPFFYQKLSQNGFEFVRKNISWERYTQEMLKAFTQTFEKYNKSHE
ncbi:glycosyltransferase family 4 protein [Patescibacteria group bacterium AH-259-L07]|nr:glycosyltransferase family 4 protein [Patescibacteria group bacterium AH-259-L07]